MLKRQSLIKDAYVAFNARDIDAILKVMHPQLKCIYMINDGLLQQMDIELS